MKRKTLKILAFCIVILLFFSSIFAGCATNNEAPDKESTENRTTEKTVTEKEVTEQTQSTEDSNLVGNIYKTGLPIVKDKITIKVATQIRNYNKVPFANMENTKAFEERTNIHVEWEEIPEGSVGDRMSILLSSGDLPDALLQLMNNERLINNYDTGLFLPLDELIDTWAPNIKNILSNPLVKSQLVLPDGKIYSIPGGEMAPWLQGNGFLYVNTAWLDRLGLEMPTTTDEYKDILKAIKLNDADGDGDKSNEIPLSMVGADNFINLMGSFGIACERDFIFIRNGKVDYAPATENFKKAMEYFHELYGEGLIDSESFAQNQNQLRAKAKTGILFSFEQFLASSTVGDDLENQYEVLMPLIGPEGYQEYSQRLNAAYHSLVISSKTKHPEAIIRWADYLNSDNTVMLEAYVGLESQGLWTDMGNGKYLINSGNTPEGMSFAEWNANTAWYTSIPVYFSDDFVTKYRDLEGDPIARDALRRTLQYLEFKLDEVMPRSMIEADVNQELTLIGNELKILYRDFMAKSIIQGFDDNDWNTFQSNLKKANYERYVELKQMIYDNSKK